MEPIMPADVQVRNALKKGPCTYSELVSRVSISESSLATVLTRLKNDGVVTRGVLNKAVAGYRRGTKLYILEE